MKWACVVLLALCLTGCGGNEERDAMAEEAWEAARSASARVEELEFRVEELERDLEEEVMNRENGDAYIQNQHLDHYH